MILKRHIFIKLICVITAFTMVVLLSGCIPSIYSDGCINIRYNNHNYKYLTDWEMTSDEYTKETIKQDGVSLNIRLYDNDVNTEFLFCEDNGSLYHNEDFKFPDNNAKSINHLTFYLHSSNDKIVISDSKAKKEFEKIISGKSTDSIDFADNILTIAIYYKNFPAVYYYGNLVIDKNDKYWISCSFADDSDNINERYYSVDNNSVLLSYIK